MDFITYQQQVHQTMNDTARTLQDSIEPIPKTQPHAGLTDLLYPYQPALLLQRIYDRTRSKPVGRPAINSLLSAALDTIMTYHEIYYFITYDIEATTAWHTAFTGDSIIINRLRPHMSRNLIKTGFEDVAKVIYALDPKTRHAQHDLYYDDNIQPHTTANLTRLTNAHNMFTTAYNYYITHIVHEDEGE